jgi:uncharacterized membrane protein
MRKPERLAIPTLLACLAACTAPDRAPAPAADAARPTAAAQEDPLAATHLRARGNEPFWAIDVEGDTLHYVTPEMPDGRTLVAERAPHTGGVAFTGEDDGRPFSLDLTRTACSDSMSGEHFEFTATWDYDGRRMQGCARRGD